MDEGIIAEKNEAWIKTGRRKKLQKGCRLPEILSKEIMKIYAR